MKKLILISGLILLGSTLFAQDTIRDMAQDSIRDYSNMYIGDARIDSLLQLSALQNQKFKTVPGYRIQIFKGSGNNALNSALVVRDKFVAKYGVPAYITFNEPYYRVRVGDFRTRMDAIKFLQRIKRAYPLAWEIQDEVNFNP
ncbi:MAG: SPOR domain-containing protein [Bacteroidales bacterium]|nr:SPOR domain-containing protein [Bacteroidales bacterium]